MAKHNEILTAYKISDIKPVTHNTRQFTFMLPENSNFDFLPGDHMKIYPDPDDLVEWRPYTPTNKPGRSDHFELIIKRYDDGIVSRFVHQRETGDLIWMSGPHEGGHYTKGMAHNIAMVAGGTGITPMISMIRTIMEEDSDTRIYLVFANKAFEDIILKDEFDWYSEKYPCFSRYYILDNPPEKWEMGKGRIDDEVLKTHLCPAGDDTVAFVCGPPMMQIELRKKLIGLGYAPDRVIFP
jgi:cytochrome-b5 reductase